MTNIAAVTTDATITSAQPVTAFDPHLTPAHELEAAALDSADLPLVTIDGTTATFGEAWTAVRETALGLRSLGLKRGDRVIVLIPNSFEAIWAWFGVQAAGGIDAPISGEAPGAFLQYLCDDLAPTAVIGTGPLLQRLASVVTQQPDLAVVVGESEGAKPFGDDVRHVSFEELRAQGRDEPYELELGSADDVGTIMYSSGTTGPSKGVMLSQGYYSTLAQAHTEVFDLRPAVTMYCTQPLCHIDARSGLMDAVHVRGHLYLGTRFSASRYWDEVEKYDVDLFFYIGTMVHLIYKQPVRDTPPSRHRVGLGSSTPASVQPDFEARFNCQLVEAYGMTEFGLISAQRLDNAEPGHIGCPPAWVETQLVDNHDLPVPPGTPGQVVLRPQGKHLHMLGYWNKPEATAEAWRGLWFHTGDVLVQRPDGNYEYVGRTKDSIRRRGENVSAWEVEEAANRHEQVREAAAIGVASELGEEDVALLVVASHAGEPDPAELRDFMAKDLPRYALPRFIELVQELPKTPSERIAKGLVRERGVTAAAWDAEAAPRGR